MQKFILGSNFSFFSVIFFLFLFIFAIIILWSVSVLMTPSERLFEIRYDDIIYLPAYRVPMYWSIFHLKIAHDSNPNCFCVDLKQITFSTEFNYGFTTWFFALYHILLSILIMKWVCFFIKVTEKCFHLTRSLLPILSFPTNCL